MELFLFSIIWLILGAGTAFLAIQKGRDPVFWSIGIMMLSLFGLPFAIIGLGGLYLLPTVEEDEDSPDKHEFDEVLLPSETKNSSFEDFSSKQWFFYDSAKQMQGPLSFPQLQTSWKEASVNDQTYVWCEGMENWQTIGELPQFIDALAKTPSL